MYDKLGDLLNQALENGDVKQNGSDNKDPEKENSINTGTGNKKRVFSYEKKSSSGSRKPHAQKKDSGFSRSNPSYRNSTSQNNAIVIKSVPVEVSRAQKLLSLEDGYSFEDLKKAYKEKLKYYHPDKFTGNKIMSKIATDKTRLVVESYTLLKNWIETRS